MSAAALTLSTFNSAKISHLETQIVNNNKRVDHLVDIAALHENHFRAVDQKVDDMADKLATLLRINKVHLAKMTDFMQQKFGTAVAISERLIYTAYSNRLLQVLSTMKPSSKRSSTLTRSPETATCCHSSANLPTFSWWRHPIFTNRTRKLLCWCSTFHWSHLTT
jgi:hypothetical protein